MADELELEEEQPRKNKQPKPQQYQQPKQEWVNPKWTSRREKMDRRLEQAGLLKYQTKGLSQEEIARRYAAAGISINGGSSWYKDTYGVDAPEALTDRKKMFEWQSQARAGNAPSLFPTLEPQIKRVLPSGGNADRPVNYAQLDNGLLVKAPAPTAPKTNAQSPYAAGTFASMDAALKGEANWTDVPSWEREKKLKDPNFYANGEITKYPAWMQQQILADPSFDWDQVPAWQRSYYDVSSSPAGMGAAQGALMGLVGGPVGGAVGAATGGTLGYFAGKSGYDATKEFWQQDSAVAGFFGLANWLAEQAEKGIGVIAQGAAILTGNDPNFDPKKRNLDIEFNKDFNLTPGKNFNPNVLTGSSWDAGANIFEVIGPALVEAVKKNPLGMHSGAALPQTLIDVVANPEKYMGQELYLGAAEPIVLDETWVERLHAARDEIKAGRPYREVMMDMQAGVVAQTADMVGQAAADPLNFLPDMSTKIAGKVAEATGNKVAATALNQSDGFVEAGRRYKNLVQTGQALIIDPKFQVDQMGMFSRWVAGINEQGQVKAGSINPFGSVKGLLDQETQANINPSATGFLTGATIGGAIGGMLGGGIGAIPGALIGGWIADKTGYLRSMVTQTPHSRAQTGAGMFYENISAMLQMFDEPTQAGKYLKALANNDMNTWAELGSRFAESPEFYTVLPAIKEFNTAKLDGIVQAWDMTAGNRDLLTRIADVMGEGAGVVLEDLAKHGTAEQDFQRVVKKLQESTSPEAKALLAEVEAGTFTAETLKQMVDVFSGEGALPWHPGQWKAMMLDELGSHFDKWVTQRLMLDKSPEAVSAFFRTSALMKQAQSILLLGGSPGYAITNGLSNMVHRAVSGLYGYMTPGQINGFMERFGVTPARFDEGVGIGGVVEQAAGNSRVKMSEIDKAVKGKGPLTRAKDALGKLSKGMPFSKLSSWFEANEGRQAFTIGMKDFWSQSWRRGVGFSKMSGEMEAVIRGMGQDPNLIYAAIESGMNQAEIEKAIFGRGQEIQARSLIHDAATKTGMSAGDAAAMLEKIGVLDTLDQFLKGQTTRDGISQAFRRAEQVAQDWIDMRTGEDLKATAEAVTQRVGLEGAAAALDVSMKAHGAYTDVWMDHYYRFGEVMNDLYTLSDQAQMDKSIDLAYDQSDREFRRVDARNAANYKGIFDAWGLSGDPRALRMLDGMGEVGAAMSGAYRQMRENFRAWRQKWAGDLTNPARWDELETVRFQNDRLFRDAFQAKHNAEVKQGAALAEIYESLYGPAAGEAARKWWEDMVAFNDEIVKKERDFRGEMNQARRSGVPADLIAEQKQKYYSETKIYQIAELERINGEGIARLERVIKKGGGTSDTGQGGSPAPSPSDQPSAVSVPTAEVSRVDPSKVQGVDPVEEVNALMAAAEQRKGREKAEAEARKDAVWEVASEYWGKGGNYNKGILQDGFALVNALRKPEYGGIPDLTWLDDPRLTPELTREILERRKVAKETNAAAAADEAFKVTAKGKKKKFDPSQINEDTTILRAIALLGGINLETAKDLTGETKPKSAPGVFTRRGHNKGWDVSDMARMLADEGYPINLDDVSDPGGVQQTKDLINRARAGDKVYPKGHDFTAELDAAELAWAESFDFDNVPEIPFDSALWQTEFDNAVQYADLGKVYEMIGTFPDERLDTPAPSGELWREFLSRVADDVAVRATEEVVTEKVAEHAARAEESIRAAEDHAEAVTKRQVLLESLAEAFPKDADKIGTWGQVLDVTAGWYAKMTGETADDFYNRYFGDVRRVSGAGDQVSGEGLMQSGAGPVWYSKLTQTVEGINQPKMSVEQLKGAITKAGVKADELKWMGFDEWMAGKKSVTKAEALEFLRENQVQMQEVVKGNSISNQDAVNKSYEDRIIALQQEKGLSLVELAETPEYKAINEERNRALQEFRNQNSGGSPKFSQYTLPGGENYREVLFTLPEEMTAPKVSLPEGYKVEELFGHRTAKYTLVGPDGFGRPIPGDTYQDALISAYRNIYGYDYDTKGTFKSGHWDERNVLAHVRLNDRIDADGKRVLFVEEVQSDWHQAGREKGYQLSGDQRAEIQARLRPLEAEYNKLWNEVEKSLPSNATGEDIQGNIRQLNPQLVDEMTRLQQMENASVTAVPDAPFSKTWHEMTMKRVLRMAAEDGYDRVAWTTGEQQAARYDLRTQADEIIYQQWENNLIVRKNGETVKTFSGVQPDQLADYVGKDAATRLLADDTKVGSEGAHKISGEDLAVGGQGMKGFYDQILPAFMDKYGKKWGVKTGETRIKVTKEQNVITPDGLRNVYDELPVHSVDVTPAMRESVMGGQPLFQREQQGGLWGAGEDMPLFSGTPQKAKAETFKPTEAGRQDAMFDMRPQFGTKEPSLAPMVNESTEVSAKSRIEKLNADADFVYGHPNTRKAQIYFETVANAENNRILSERSKKPKDKTSYEKVTDSQIARAERMLEELKAEVAPQQKSIIPGTFDKGMVTFEDMKGTITAFEKGDFSTVVHETGHIYRRMLADVAERTGNPYILRDLKTVEEWAGVRDGKWDRAAEEKFARGFERYIADGKAPTPALVRAFEQFKGWMLEIYKMITGSQIDVKLTDDVRRVFDRMLGAENTRVELDNILLQMNYDPRIWYVDPQGNIVKRPKFEINVDMEKAQAQVEAMDIEGMQARAAALRERMAGGQVQPGPDAESIRSYREGWRSWGSTEEPPVKPDQVRELKDWTLGEMRKGNPTPSPSPSKSIDGEGSPDRLFQSEQPFGRYDEASGWRAESEGLDEGWREKVRPLLSAMEEGARDQVSGVRLDGASRDTSPEGQAMLRKYMRQVQNEMATTKLATVRHAERQRDFALLNYSKRYGFDRAAEAVLPYQFYTSRSLFTWAGRALDKPALYANYARLRMQQERYEKDVPERLRGKVRIPAPWLPEWAGDSLYIDPFRNLFFPENVVRYFERAKQEKTYQQIEAERVLQEWTQDGKYSEAEIAKARDTQKGKVWERAWEEAQLRRESESANPVDFFTGFFGPAWYLSTPLNLAGIKVPGISKGDPNKVTTTPLGNTSRALDTVTQGTWAEPIGDLFGLIGKAEDWGREKFNLPTRGEYAEYYTKKHVAIMVTEGKLTPEEAQIVMLEKQGPIWEEAKQRVDMELALKVPLAGLTYEALRDEKDLWSHIPLISMYRMATGSEGENDRLKAALPSLFGASLLPAGELEYRGLKQEWNEAWKLADAGDKSAISVFYDEHPEYKAWLAKNKDDGELLKSFLVNQIKDAYYAEDTTNRKQIKAELGEYFEQSFFDEETKDPLSVDINQLVQWAQMLNKKVPNVEQTAKFMETPAQPINLYPEGITAITDQFFSQRTEMFPNYYEEQAGYYALATKAEKKKYLLQHPDLTAYWDWKDNWYDAYPQYVPIFKGDAFDRVDTSGWMPGLEEIVRETAFTGSTLPSGARAALMNVWLMEGQPMDNFDTWVKSVVLPGMMYGGQ